jgi:hypothetical protein
MSAGTMDHEVQTAAREIALPAARGPVSAAVIQALSAVPGTGVSTVEVTSTDIVGDEDLQLALYLCYELHYSGIRDVDPGWEWNPALLTLRAAIEAQFESALRGLTAVDDVAVPVPTALLRLIEADDGPALSRYLETQATRDQLDEFLVHRSAYQLKEADPHTWALPRIAGRAKAAMVEIQADEYGGGNAERMHAALFAKTMTAAGLDSRYGAYLARLPAITLATVNLMSMFGLHRRLRGATVGHLAVLEMTSSLPNRRYGNGIRRLGLGPEATDFFDEHVTADAVHEQIAAHELAGGLATDEPDLRADILFGAGALLAVEARWARYVLRAWDDGESSLREIECG